MRGGTTVFCIQNQRNIGLPHRPLSPGIAFISIPVTGYISRALHSLNLGIGHERARNQPRSLYTLYIYTAQHARMEPCRCTQCKTRCLCLPLTLTALYIRRTAHCSNGNLYRYYAAWCICGGANLAERPLWLAISAVTTDNVVIYCIIHRLCILSFITGSIYSL